MEKDIETQISILIDKLNSLTAEELHIIESHQNRLQEVFDLRSNCFNLKILIEKDKWGRIEGAKKIADLIEKITVKYRWLKEDYVKAGERKLEIIVKEEGKAILELQDREKLEQDDARTIYRALDKNSRKKLDKWLEQVKTRLKREHVIFTAEQHLKDLLQRFKTHQVVAVSEIDAMLELIQKLDDAVYHGKKAINPTNKKAAIDIARLIHIKSKQLYEVLTEEKDEIIDPLEKFIKVKLTPEEKAKQDIRNKWNRFFFNRVKPVNIKHAMKGFSRPDEAQRYMYILSRHPFLLTKKARHMADVIMKQSTAMIAPIIKQSKLAGLDELTNLASRRQFNSDLADHLKKVQRSDGEYVFSVIMFDIDKFKTFNDKYGHDVGDEVLRTVARTITKVCRRETDKLYRTGGEEFNIIVADTTKKGAVRVAERARIALANEEIAFIWAKTNKIEKVKTTISLGVCDSTETLNPGFSIGENANRMIKLVDNRLYVAKETGRNKTVSEDK